MSASISKPVSRHFGPSQLRAINKIGDAMLPGSDELPRFSRTGCVAQVDRVLDHMPEQDRSDLKLLLTLFAFLPGPLVAYKMRAIEVVADWPLPFIGGLVRLVRLGLRGLIMTLYYADPEVQKRIGFEVRVAPGICE